MRQLVVSAILPVSYTHLDRVVDSGTGAGAIALNFGNVVGDTGKVYTYEIREDFAKVAQKNIETFGINNIAVSYTHLSKTAIY